MDVLLAVADGVGESALVGGDDGSELYDDAFCMAAGWEAGTLEGTSDDAGAVAVDFGVGERALEGISAEGFAGVADVEEEVGVGEEYFAGDE